MCAGEQRDKYIDKYLTRVSYLIAHALALVVKHRAQLSVWTCKFS
jgi:hypothetical protein